MTDRFTPRLSEYLDGELAREETALLERHLAGCEECVATLEALREVVAQAQRLEDRQPPGELWAGVARRIADAGETEIEPGRSGVGERTVGQRRHVSLSMPQLAAAAIALIAVSAGTVWTLLGSGAPTADGAPPALTAAPGSPAPAGVLALTAADPPAQTTAARYAAAIAELERTLFSGETTLDSMTVVKLRESLATIDRAIEEAGRALEQDSSDPYLNQHLANTLKQKVRYMRQAAAMLTVQS